MFMFEVCYFVLYTFAVIMEEKLWKPLAVARGNGCNCLQVSGFRGQGGSGA